MRPPNATALLPLPARAGGGAPCRDAWRISWGSVCLGALRPQLEEHCSFHHPVGHTTASVRLRPGTSFQSGVHFQAAHNSPKSNAEFGAHTCSMSLQRQPALTHYTLRHSKRLPRVNPAPGSPSQGALACPGRLTGSAALHRVSPHLLVSGGILAYHWGVELHAVARGDGAAAGLLESSRLLSPAAWAACGTVASVPPFAMPALRCLAEAPACCSNCSLGLASD